MRNRIKVLCVAGSHADAKFVPSQLQSCGLDADIQVATDITSYLSAIKGFLPDIIVYIESVSFFSFRTALKVLQDNDFFVPFVLVTPTLSEDAAIEALREGIDDFIVPDRLERLPVAIHNLVAKYRFEKDRTLLLKKLAKNEARGLANEEKYRSIFENSIDAILLTTLEGTVLAANPAACKIFEMTEEEICVRSRPGIVQVDDAFKKLLKDRESKGKVRGEMSMRRKDGTVFPVEISSNIFFDPSGKALNSVIIRDISERKQLQEAVERERQTFVNLFTEAPSCVGVLRGSDHIYEMANPLYLETMGRDESIFGKKLKDVFPELEPQGFIAILDRVYSSGKKFSAREMRVSIDKTGKGDISDLYFDLICLPHKDDFGQVNSLFFFANDVTEQVLLRRETEERERNYRAIFEFSPLPRFVVDESTLMFTEFNETALRVYGYTREEFSTMTLPDLFYTEDRPAIMKFVEEIKGSARPVKLVEEQVKKDGTHIIAETNAVLFSYHGQKCFLIAVADLTEQTILQQKLTEIKLSAQKKILRSQIKGQEEERELLGKELHDNVNQQLCAAQLYLGIARQSEEMRKELTDKSEELIKSAIHDIRNLCKSLAPPSLKNVGLIASLNDLVDNYKLANKFAITFNDTPELDLLNPELQLSLFRIVQEQLTNITKYASAKNVMINFKISGNVVKLDIHDDGVGFDVKAKRRGVGLTNIKNRIELFSGRLSIQSAPGKGCILTVEVPVTVDEKPRRQSLSFLVAEDDLLDQELIQKAITEIDKNHQITFVSTGADLIKLLGNLTDEQMPSLIVLDYNMPGMNGYDTLVALKQKKRFKKIPKVIYSTARQDAHAKECLSAQAKAYIKKGVTLEEIKENVKEMIQYCE